MRFLVVLSVLLGTLLPSFTGASTLADRYREAAGRIIGRALVSDHAYDRLEELCDTIGNRLSGSENLNRAIAWATAALEEDGFTNVHTEEVMVPVWVRGEERCTLLEPYAKDLPMLGLGRSVGTPPGGIEADVVAATTFEELEAMGEEAVRGKIVLWDVPFTSYGQTVRYRGGGSDAAAKLGGLASLVRSVGPVSLVTPHTGALRYKGDVKKVPGAALTIEDATLIHRLLDRGEKVRVRLAMAADTLPDAPSANVVAEVVGSELPDEVVVVGGHLDSWDVGQGAQDDGVGCMIAWEAARLIHELDLRPRRTIRVVLFTNEENGLAGGSGYLEAHRESVRDHVAAFESDSGNGLADGFRYHLEAVGEEDEESDAVKARLAARREEGLKILRETEPLLSSLRATRVFPAHSGADVGPLAREGVPCFGLNHDTTKYFEIHHTNADTFDKIDRDDLNRNVAIMAVMLYVVADMPDRLPSYVD